MHATSRRQVLASIGLMSLMCLAPGRASAEINTNGGSVAIRGYDPVAYFTDSRPVKGSPSFQHEWQGALWHFASAEHRDMFAANPERYAPRYGGYCAVGMGYGQKVRIDPQAWSIVGGRLYLNNSPGIARRFLADPQGNIARADQHWRQLGGR